VSQVKVNNSSGKKALVLIRTPFQAWLFEKIIEEERLTQFDLIYFTQNLSDEDKLYFDKLSQRSRNSYLIFVSRKNFDILNHLGFWLKTKKLNLKKNYDVVFLSSIESLVLNAIASKKCSNELVTFDDGTGNYNCKSIYFDDVSRGRLKLYQKLFGTQSLGKIKSRIKRHYTLHINLKNIVGRDRLLEIKGWVSPIEKKDDTFLKKEKIYFIGSPFEEVLKKNEIVSIENYAKKIGVDAYVKHPRERNALAIGAVILDKRGRIAEEAILDDAKGHEIILIGSLSSVMFNLSSCVKKRIILTNEKYSSGNYLLDLAVESGCVIEKI